MSTHDGVSPAATGSPQSQQPTDRCGAITLPCDHDAYARLLDLFTPDLEEQAAGTADEIRLGSYEVLVPVPYRAWRGRLAEVSRILDASGNTVEVRRSWPSLKAALESCCCVIAATHMRIATCAELVGYTAGATASARPRRALMATSSGEPVDAGAVRR